MASSDEVAGTPAARPPLAIAFAIQEWPTRGRPAGGAGIYVGKLAKALAARGHRVHVVTCAHADLPAESVEAGVAVHRIGEAAPNARDADALARYGRAVAERLRALDAEHRFDVVEFQEWAAEGWAFHPRPDQAMVVRLQAPSHFVRQFEYADHSAAERRVDELERWPLERADLVTAPSMMIARFAARSWSFDPEGVTIIPNGVDAAAFPAGVGPSRAAEPLVLCVNRLSPIKGPEVFVRAAAAVHAARPGVRFRMVGRIEVWDGELSEVRLRRIAEEAGLPRDRLEIAGPVDHDGLVREYGAADVCVNPSLSESYSLTSAEALASGKACVLSGAMGIVEFLRDGDDCMIAPAGDPAAFASKILTLLGDDGLRARLGAAARATVERFLATDVTAAATESAYRAVIAEVWRRPAVPPVRLAIAMLTYNALAHTQRCLASIARHTPVPHRVFVLDNASTDESRDWLAALDDPTVSVMLGATNLGVPGGRNRLLRSILPHLADDGAIVFMDNDLEVREGWWEPALRFLEAHPSAGIAGEVGHPIVVRAAGRELLPMPPSPAEVDVASGGFACFVRAQCARDVGLFDERLGLFWHEDDDYCVRAIMHGWSVHALGSGRVVHHEHASGAALPGIAAGGSAANQRYLAAKWRALGLVDDAGRIVRPALAATLVLRRDLARRLGRPEPVPQEELARAASDLSALLMARDLLAHVEARAADLSPTLCALLDANCEQAAARRERELASALGEVRHVVRSCRTSTLLRKHVALPAPPASPPKARRRLSKICDARDWDAADWWRTASAAHGDGGRRNWYLRHRKAWECGQVSYAVEQLVPSPRTASGVVVHAAADPVVFGLTNHVASVTAVDEYGAGRDAPAEMIEHPERFAPVPFARGGLRVVKAAASRTGLPDRAFDFAVACSLHRCESEDDAARVLAECARLVRPGGPVIAVTEVGLNGVARSGLLVPEQIDRVIAASGLAAIEEPDYSVDDGTLAGLVDLDQGSSRMPHLVLAQGNALFTSGVLVLEAAGAAVAGVGS
jgi:glycosyltransferase involved in cell wall biosynthesis/GT2 family glycosyltransferase/SAM-dependent methyltransferase